VSEPSLDRTRLSGHEGNHSCALRKTGTEARKPGRSAHCDRQSPGMDQRHQARPQSGTSRSGPRFFGVRSGGEPAPSLDMAEVSQRSATGSRSSEGSILTRRDAPPDFLASAIIRAMDAFMRGCNCLTDRCESDRSIRAAKCRHACDQCALATSPCLLQATINFWTLTSNIGI